MRKYLYCMLILVSLILFCSNEDEDTTIEGTGTIEAKQIDISSAVAGKIEQVLVEEGDEVKTGDILLKIDDTDYRIRRKLASAQLDAAEANLKLILSGAREEDVQQAQENVRATNAAFQKAKANYERVKNLFENGSATKSTLDDAKAGYEIADAKFKSAKKAFEKLVKGARIEEIKMAQANKNQAEANLELIEKQIEDCIIKAPSGGKLVNKLVEPGERIMPNGMVATIADTDSMCITIYVSDKNIGKVKTGQKAEIRIDTYEDRVFEGIVRFIAEEAEFTPKNIQTKEERVKLVFGVKIKIDNKEGILKSGLPADAKILID